MMGVRAWAWSACASAPRLSAGHSTSRASRAPPRPYTCACRSLWLKKGEAMNKLRILIAEDHETVREGMKLLINSQPDMEVIGEAGDGLTAIQYACDLLPAIVLMDVGQQITRILY